MTNVERSPNPRNPNERAANGGDFVIRIWSFLWNSSFVLIQASLQKENPQARGPADFKADDLCVTPGHHYRRWLRPGTLPWPLCIALPLPVSPVAYRQRNSRHR